MSRDESKLENIETKTFLNITSYMGRKIPAKFASFRLFWILYIYTLF